MVFVLILPEFELADALADGRADLLETGHGVVDGAAHVQLEVHVEAKAQARADINTAQAAIAQLKAQLAEAEAGEEA